MAELDCGLLWGRCFVSCCGSATAVFTDGLIGRVRQSSFSHESLQCNVKCLQTLEHFDTCSRHNGEVIL